MHTDDKARSLDRRKFIGLTGVAAAGVMLADAPAARAAPKRRWQPDGSNLPRLGLVAAAHDFNPESEIAIMNQGRTSIFASRMPIRFTKEILSDPTHADAAIDLLMRLEPRAILYASTSTSYYLGLDGETAFRTRLETRTKGIPVIFPAAALAEAARAVGARRIALVHPPWFADAPHALGETYFTSRGFTVVSSKRVTPARDLSEVPASEVHDWIVANTPRDAQAVVQAGNGLRAIGAIEVLEKSLGRPVITANQALLWHGMRAARVTAPIKGYGSLMSAHT